MSSSYKETAEDLNRKYLSTYAFLRGTQVVMCREFEQDKGKIIGVFDLDNKESLSTTIEGGDVTPIELNAGYFNIEHSKFPLGWQFIRRSRRQNKKGLSNETAYLQNHLQHLYPGLGKRFPTLNFDFTVIKHLLKPTYPAYQDALELCNKHLTVALDANFAIALSHLDSDKYLLMSRYGFIGKVNNQAMFIEHQGSFQEVRDFVARNRLNLEVHVSR